MAFKVKRITIRDLMIRVEDLGWAPHTPNFSHTLTISHNFSHTLLISPNFSQFTPVSYNFRNSPSLRLFQALSSLKFVLQPGIHLMLYTI